MSSWGRTEARRRRARRTRRAERGEEPQAPPDPLAPPPRAEPAGEGDGAWIDLIHHTPLVPGSTEALRHGLRFAFESGDAGGLLGRAADEAPVGPSTWDPKRFAGGLFLPQLADTCFGIRIDGVDHAPSRVQLVRQLSRPPQDARDVTLRVGVLRELCESPGVRRSLERCYVSLRALRRLLDEQPISPGETTRRKVEVLTTIKSFFDEAADGLASSTSALGRLGRAAADLRDGAAYRRLDQLLDFDRHMVTAEVRLVLGSDGRIRDFALMRSHDNRDNPLVRSPWRRFWSRLWSWLRGYRYGENEVVLRLLDEVFADLEDAVLPLFRLAGDLELYLCALAFRDRARAAGLEVCLPELVDAPGEDAPPGPLELRGLFNPLLFLQDVTPVPCDLVAEGHDSILLVTGPNSGGKTRLLQAVAIAALLAHGGLFVPAAAARLTRAPTMFVSIVEAGQADQKEGRLGTELLRVRTLFEQLRPGTFVILDELCSGTNPSEGIAIFEMVISLLPRLRPQVLLTTHFLDAARDLEARPHDARLSFLQVELDADQRPTYQFVPGVAPTSLARALAARLGVTREELEALVERRREQG